MPRYVNDDMGRQQTIAVRVPAEGTAGTDLESSLCIAPFDGYVSKVEYSADAAYTGANTDYRNFRVRNKYQSGLGICQIAALAGSLGNNLVAYVPTVIPLSDTTAAAPAYKVQPTTTPTVAPVLSQGTGSLTTGHYLVAYSYTINGVEGQLSPYAEIDQDGSHGIAIAAINVPQGVDHVNYYLLDSPGTKGLVTSATSGAARTLNAQGNGTLPAGYSRGDVTQGDLLTYYSLHTGNGLADPGGLVRVTFVRT